MAAARKHYAAGGSGRPPGRKGSDSIVVLRADHPDWARQKLNDTRWKNIPSKYRERERVRKVLLLVCLLLSLIAPTVADEHPLNDAHGKRNMDCADCHEVDNPTKRARMNACFDCHKSYSAIAKLTATKHPNPHDSHQGELQCYQCHRPHKENKLFCNECHEFRNFKFQ